MEEQNNITKQKGKFIRLMHEKGYRGRFFFYPEKQWRLAIQDELPACLDHIIKATQEQKEAKNRFDLDTTTIDSIWCIFRISFDEERGFRIHEVTLESKRLSEKKFFKPNNNHQIQGGSSGRNPVSETQTVGESH